MALALNDRVQQQGTANTTVSFTLTASVTGFQTFAVIGNGNTTYYAATDASGNWEVGIGTYSTTGPTLTRTTILSSSNSGSAVTFSGTVNVFVTYPSEKSINYDADGVATIGQTLGYSDTGIIGSFASTVAGYNQVIIQNKSNATNASANLNISNDTSTSTAGFVELGINSSTFTGSGSFNIPSASYVASASTDLTIGTYGAYNVHFVTNSNTTDAMTIFNDGGISLGNFANPGIANMAASKFVPGYSAVTSAGGTTVLTEDSNYYQNLLGSTTQTFQLPDATTLLVGTTFIFDNDSTGTLTITDNASATIDSIPAGGVDYIYLADNSTNAGTWRKHAFIPASYDFNNTIASFGNAAITNAVWNGTTIGTAYGGTGLTSFGSANYALYSTSSSALAAGTLPVAAGGTGATTLTGYTYGNGTGAFTASTTIPFSAITGTVPVNQGGTGQTSYTDGQLLIGNSTGNTLTKASLTAGTGISITPGSGSITIASTVAAGLTITDDTTTATALYPTFTSATSGSITGASVTSTKYKFVPSTGTLTAPNVEASNGLFVNNATVTSNYTIPAGYNASSVGPVTVASGAAVTIPSGSRWLVL